MLSTEAESSLVNCLLVGSKGSKESFQGGEATASNASLLNQMFAQGLGWDSSFEWQYYATYRKSHKCAICKDQQPLQNLLERDIKGMPQISYPNIPCQVLADSHHPVLDVCINLDYIRVHSLQNNVSRMNLFWLITTMLVNSVFF